MNIVTGKNFDLLYIMVKNNVIYIIYVNKY